MKVSRLLFPNPVTEERMQICNCCSLVLSNHLNQAIELTTKVRILVG